MQDWLRDYTERVHENSPLHELAISNALLEKALEPPQEIEQDPNNIFLLTHLLSASIRNCVDEADIQAWHHINDPSKRYWLDQMIRSAHMRSMTNQALLLLMNQRITVADCTALTALYTPWDQFTLCEAMWKFQKMMQSLPKGSVTQAQIDEIFIEIPNYKPSKLVSQSVIIEMMNLQRRIEQKVNVSLYKQGISHDMILSLKVQANGIPKDVNEQEAASSEKLILTASKFLAIKNSGASPETQALFEQYLFHCELKRLGLWSVYLLSQDFVQPINSLGMLSLIKREEANFNQVKRQLQEHFNLEN